MIVKVTPSPEQFYIENLRLKNYRCFDSFQITLEPGVNLILGNNGSGKTALLGALSIALGSWFMGLPNVTSRGIQKEEMRLVRQKKEDITTLEQAGECSIFCTGSLLGYSLEWERTRYTGSTTHKNASDLFNLSTSRNEEVVSGNDCLLPIIAYYGTGRLWGERRLGVMKKSKLNVGEEKTGRYSGYNNALDLTSNEKLLKSWLKRQAEASFHEGKVFPTLESVYATITRCVEGAQRVYWDPREDDLMVVFENDEQIPMYLLSDGQRNICATVGDIAMRCVQLNPHLGIHASSKTSGVVLIDEIDLHLHPNWQRRIISDLQQCFPHIQFIATTHSPFIVQAAKKLNLIELEDRKPSIKTFQKEMSIEDAAEWIMGVDIPQRSRKYNEVVALSTKMFDLKKKQDACPKDSPQYNELKTRVREIRDEILKSSVEFSEDPVMAVYLKQL